MISIYLLDLKRSENETEKITSKLSDKLSKRIFETKNKERQKERAFSYLLAEYLIKSAYPCDEKREITFLPSGKPIVKNTDLSISVTHSGELAAVAVYNDRGIADDAFFVAAEFVARVVCFLSAFRAYVPVPDIVHLPGVHRVPVAAGCQRRRKEKRKSES
jgi:hypothetical protein